MSDIERIAAMLGVSDLDAKLFCAAVERKCRDYVPPLSIILRYLQRAQRNKRSADDIAAAILKAGLQFQHTGNQLLRKPPSKPSHVPYTKPNRGVSLQPATPRPERYRSWEPDDHLPLSPILRHDPRTATDSLPKCPHGVLTTRKCAICDPEGFRLQNGDQS